MTREDFLNMDWNDSHIGYDIVVGNNFRRVAYMALSSKYPECLCLVADNKDFPLSNSGCGMSTNLSPANIIEYLNEKKWVKKVVAVIDQEVYDLDTKVYINYIDAEVLFNVIPYK